MLKSLLLVLTAAVLFSCGSAKTAYKKYYPQSLSKSVYFNMPISEFHTLKGTKNSDFTDDSFRLVYLEDVNEGNVESIVYYFDADGDMPLYEMIFIYKDEASRDAEAKKLLGAPNDGEEWKFKMDPYDMHAWNFQKKLVMVALIPNTEWGEEFDVK